VKGKGKRGGSVRTHYAARQAGIADSGVQSRDNSIPPCCKLWFPFDEGSGDTVTDVVGGVAYNMVTEDGLVNWGGDAHSLGFGAIEAGAAEWQLGATPITTEVTPTSGSLPSIGTKAHLFVTLQGFMTGGIGGGLRYGDDGDDYIDIGIEGATHVANKIVGSSAFYGYEDAAQMPDGVSTPVGGDWVMHGLAVDAPSNASKAVSCYYNNGTSYLIKTDSVPSSSSVYDFAATKMSVSQVQVNRGTALFVFSGSLPTDVPEALAWMRTQWIAGNKVIYPDWVSLT